MIPTALSGNKTGFTNRMGKDKPAPKKLQLKFEDLQKMNISCPEFLTTAKFDYNEYDKEN